MAIDVAKLSDEQLDNLIENHRRAGAQADELRHGHDLAERRRLVDGGRELPEDRGELERRLGGIAIEDHRAGTVGKVSEKTLLGIAPGRAAGDDEGADVGVEHDGLASLRLLLAEQGLAGSQTTLAMMYADGRGVEKDPEQARHWYRLAGFDDSELVGH